MDLTGDRRGQSIQIGAIILFGALIILLSTYQAFVVPDQNREVEFKHSQAVQNDMKELRSDIISVASDGGTSSVSVKLGTEYPSRAIFLNPGPPSGSLRTVGTSNESINISVANATAIDGTTEVGDYWNGTTRNYSSGDFVYRPNYNEYDNAPTTIYSNTVLYNQFEDGNLTLTDQSLVDGRSISLIALNGSLSTGQSGSVSLDLRATSASATRVPITNESAGENVTFAVPTRLSETKWEELLQPQLVANGGHIRNDGISVVEQSGTFDRLVVEMEPGVTYNLKLSRVGVGSNVDTTTPATYLVKARGQDAVVPEGQNVTLEVQARDRYNNPSSGELVQANASFGNVTENAKTDGDGVVELTYSPPENINGGAEPVRINVSLGDTGLASPSFNASTPENVSFSISVDNTDGSGTNTNGNSGSYSVEWETPSDSQVNNCPTVPPQGSCIVGSSEAFLYDIDLTMATDPTADGADVTYAVSNQTALALERTTGITATNGKNTTTVFPVANGTEYVYTDSGSDGDRLELDATVDNDIDGTAKDPDNTGTNSGVQFSVTNDADRSLTVTDIYVEPQDSAVARLDDPVSGEGKWDSEFFFDVEGTTYTADFGGGETLPFNFDLSNGSNANDEPTIGSGQTVDVFMYQFQDSGDAAINMEGKTLNMSFTFSNGVQKNFTVTMGGGGNTNRNFDITINSVNDPVVETEDLKVEVTVENTGSSQDTQDVDLLVDTDQDGTFEQTPDTEADLTLGPGDTSSFTQTYTTQSGDSPEVDVKVQSEDDAQQQTATVNQRLQAVESDGVTGGSQLNFTVENAGSSQLTVETFSVDAADAVNGNIELDNSDSPELKIRRATQNGEANRAGNGNNDARFQVGGQTYDLVADSVDAPGQYAEIAASDDDVTVDFRGFTKDFGTVQYSDQVNADITVTLGLSDGTTQTYYFSSN